MTSFSVEGKKMNLRIGDRLYLELHTLYTHPIHDVFMDGEHDCTIP
jgi:hypothetical protein